MEHSSWPVSVIRLRASYAGAMTLAALVLLLQVSDPVGVGLEVHAMDPPADSAGGVWPSFAATAGRPPLLVWTAETDTGHALRGSVLDGSVWAEPATLAAGSRWFVNWADFPQVARDAGGRTLVTWLQQAESGPAYAYHVRWRLLDPLGRQLASGLLHDDDSPTEHGFVSVTPRPGGGFLAVWLDGRAHAEGGQQLRTRVVLADGRLEPEAVLDERTCDCCQTDLVALPGGGYLVAWRDRDQDEVRDVAVARLGPNGPDDRTFPAADGWVMPACPVNGPALAVAADGRAALCWFTGAPGPRVRLAVTEAGGSAWGPALRVDEGRTLGRVEACFDHDGRLLLVWLEERDAGPEWRIRTWTATAGLGPTRSLAPARRGRGSGFPRAVAVDDGWLVTWQGEHGPAVAHVFPQRTAAPPAR